MALIDGQPRLEHMCKTGLVFVSLDIKGYVTPLSGASVVPTNNMGKIAKEGHNVNSKTWLSLIL